MSSVAVWLKSFFLLPGCVWGARIAAVLMAIGAARAG